MLTAPQLYELLRFDPETGQFTWLVATRGHAAGSGAGSTTSLGYIHIKIQRRRYYAHRLAWFYVNGRWPICQIDHINRKKDDNKLCNLREATPVQNSGNSGLQKNNTSGARGVERQGNKWRARIKKGGRLTYLGTFDSIELATAAYNNAAIEVFGPYYKSQYIAPKAAE
jgi:hypothetical protein